MNNLRPRSRNVRSRKSEAAILDAAMLCFRDRGMAATSMDEIAERAGVSRATIYYNFLSKEDIAVRIAERFRLEGYVQYLRDKDLGVDALTLIDSFFCHAGTWVTAHREVAMLGTLAAMRGTGRNPDRPPTTQVLQELIELAQKQSLVLPSVRPPTIAGILAGILTHYALVGRRPEPDDDNLHQTDWLLEMVHAVIDGIRS